MWLLGEVMTLEYLISIGFKVITFKLLFFLSCEQFKKLNKMFSPEPNFSIRYFGLLHQKMLNEYYRLSKNF